MHANVATSTNLKAPLSPGAVATVSWETATPAPALTFSRRGALGRGDISEMVPSCSPSIRARQTGKASEEGRALIAPHGHAGRGFSRRPVAPPGGRGWYSPVRVDAVVVDHGFQRAQIGCERKKERDRVREGRGGMHRNKGRRAGDKRSAGN